jgi:hypothetical protein
LLIFVGLKLKSLQILLLGLILESEIFKILIIPTDCYKQRAIFYIFLTCWQLKGRMLIRPYNRFRAVWNNFLTTFKAVMIHYKKSKI